MKPLIFKGDIVQCPRCSTNNHKIQHDLRKGDILCAEVFCALPGIKPAVNGAA